MTQAAAIPTEFVVNTTPAQLTGVNLRAALLIIENKSSVGANLFVKLGSPFIQSASAVQTITFSATPDAGTWTVTDRLGNVSSALAHNIDAGTLQTALEALGAIGSGNVTVTGTMAAGFVLTFASTLANTTQAGLAVASSLTLSTGQVSAVQAISFSLPPTAGTFTVADWAGNLTSDLTAATLTPLQLAAALNALPAINGAVTNITQDPTTKAFSISFGGALANQPVPLLTVVGTGISNSSVQASASWMVQCAPSPAAGTFGLSYGGDLSGPLAYNIAAAALQTALEALPGIGVGNVAVTGTSLYAGFTVTLQGALANVSSQPLGVYDNRLVLSASTLPANASGREVKILATPLTGGSGVASVAVTASTTTAGVAPAAVTPRLVVNTPGNTKPASEGLLIAAGNKEEFDGSGVPIDGLWAYASADNTPVLVLAG